MKLITRKHRIIAVLLGVAIVVTLVVQILRDGRAISGRRAAHQQQEKINH